MSHYVLLCSLELFVVTAVVATSGFFLGKRDALSASGKRVGCIGSLVRLGLIEFITVVAHYVINTKLLLDINNAYLDQNYDPGVGPEYSTFNVACCFLPIKMLLSGAAYLIAYDVGYKHYHKTASTSHKSGT